MREVLQSFAVTSRDTVKTHATRLLRPCQTKYLGGGLGFETERARCLRYCCHPRETRALPESHIAAWSLNDVKSTSECPPQLEKVEVLPLLEASLALIAEQFRENSALRGDAAQHPKHLLKLAHEILQNEGLSGA